MEKKVLGSNHGHLSKRLVLLKETSQVPRNQAAPSDVTEFQYQHDNALKIDASSTVGRTTPLETVEVVGHCLRVNLSLPHLLLKEDGIVDMWTARKDLASDEDIVGVGQLGVLQTMHGVEGASTDGEPIC